MEKETREPYSEEEELDVWCFLYNELKSRYDAGVPRNFFTMTHMSSDVWDKYRLETNSARKTDNLKIHFRKSMVGRLDEVDVTQNVKLCLLQWIQIPLVDGLQERMEAKYKIKLDVDPVNKTLRSVIPLADIPEDKDTGNADRNETDDVPDSTELDPEVRQPGNEVVFVQETTRPREKSVQPEDEPGIWGFVACHVLEHAKKLDDLEGLWSRYIEHTGCEYSATHINTFKESMCPSLYKAPGLTSFQVLQLYKELQLPIDKSVETILEMKFQADVRIRHGRLYAFKFWEVEDYTAVRAMSRMSDDAQRNYRIEVGEKAATMTLHSPIDRKPARFGGDPDQRWRQPKYDPLSRVVGNAGRPTTPSMRKSSCWDGDDRVGLGIVRQKYSVEEEARMWNYLYDVTCKSHSLALTAKGHRIWYEYINSGQSDRTADNLCSHYRRHMQSTLYRRPIEKKKMLELYRRLKLPMSEDVKSILEEKFDVKINQVNRILVSYRDRNPQNAAPEDDDEDVAAMAPVRAKAPRDMREDVDAHIEDDSDDDVPPPKQKRKKNRRSPSMSLATSPQLRRKSPRKRKAGAAAAISFDVVAAEADDEPAATPPLRSSPRLRKADEPTGSPKAKRAPPVAQVKAREMGVRPARWDTSKEMTKGTTPAKGAQDEQPAATTTSPKKPTAVTKPQPRRSERSAATTVSLKSATTSTTIQLTRSVDVVKQTSKTLLVDDEDMGSPPDDESQEQPVVADAAGGFSPEAMASPPRPTPLPSTLELEVSSDDDVVASAEPSGPGRRRMEKITLGAVVQPMSAPKMTQFLESAVTMFATFGVDLKAKPDVLQTIANEEMNVVKLKGEGAQWSMLAKLHEQLEKGKQSLEEYAKKMEVEFKKASVVEPLSSEVARDESGLQPKVELEDVTPGSLAVTKDVRMAAVKGLLMTSRQLPMRTQRKVVFVVVQIDSFCARIATSADDYRKQMNSKAAEVDEMVEHAKRVLRGK